MSDKEIELLIDSNENYREWDEDSEEEQVKQWHRQIEAELEEELNNLK